MEGNSMTIIKKMKKWMKNSEKWIKKYFKLLFSKKHKIISYMKKTKQKIFFFLLENCSESNIKRILYEKRHKKNVYKWQERFI